MTVSGPPISVARTGPPPESRFAPAIPDTVTGPPSVDTVAVTSGGTVSAKLTLQPEVAHAGALRLRRPPDTDCTTAGIPLRGLAGAGCGPAGGSLTGLAGAGCGTAGGSLTGLADAGCGPADRLPARESYMMVSVI